MNNPTETKGDIIAKLERDLKSAMDEIERQSFARHGLERENAALRAKIADYENGWKACMDDNAEEQHCTCVPALTIKIESLQAENAALKDRAEKAEADLKSALDKVNEQEFKILGLEMELKEKTYDD